MKIWFPMSKAGTGSEILTRQLAKNLTLAGVETVVTPYSPLFEISTKALTAFGLKPPAGTSLIHANAATAEGFSRFGIPMVLTAHGAFERAVYDQHKRYRQRQFHSKVVRPGIAASLQNATALTAVSRWVADIYRQEYAAKEVEVISNWIDTNLFSPSTRTRSGKLLFVGRPAWQKGSHLLPALSASLGPDFELTCTLRENEWAGTVPANVRLIGPVAQDGMPELYRTHDALLVPSIAEGFCLAAAEAMACGLPVFGFRGHGLDDVLEPVARFCAADMLNVSGLSECVRNVFADEKLYRDVSGQGREHVITHFTPQIALEKYLALYAKVLA